LRRLLFVAVSRAKYGLFLTSHQQSESGKKLLPVKFMQETEQDGVRRSAVLPTTFQNVIITDREPEQLRVDVNTLWHSRHSELTPPLRSLLTERLSHYVMSPTHLNNFINVEWAGPFTFLLNTLLRFPEASTPDSVYGDALHRALEQYQQAWQGGGKMTSAQAYEVFANRLNRSFISDTDKQVYGDRGKRALTTYLKTCGNRLRQPAGVEVDFRREGCTLDGAVLTGKIDRLEIDSNRKTVRIIDFKSGTASIKWGSDSKYLNYKRQLYFYHLLIQTSRTYKDYKVESAALEFIEPLPDGECARPLELEFDDTEFDNFKRLLLTVWEKIQALDLPDISNYPATARGVRQFEADLLGH
jgi:DNA helicase-2/ATP-dependent DNA helicase PcrA